MMVNGLFWLNTQVRFAQGDPAWVRSTWYLIHRESRWNRLKYTSWFYSRNVYLLLYRGRFKSGERNSWLHVASVTRKFHSLWLSWSLTLDLVDCQLYPMNHSFFCSDFSLIICFLSTNGIWMGSLLTIIWDPLAIGTALGQAFLTSISIIVTLTKIDTVEGSAQYSVRILRR